MNLITPMSVALLLALQACGSAPTKPAAAPPVMMRGMGFVTASLSGASEVPPVAGAATGTLEADLDAPTRVLSWTLTARGLSGPATAAHFHGPAMPGSNAGVVVPIAGLSGTEGTAKGSATLTEAQAADLMAGRWYVNVHTAAHPGGEIRGQVNARP